jgi:hypothetical protein
LRSFVGGAAYTTPIAKDLTDLVAAIESNTIGLLRQIGARLADIINSVRAKVRPILRLITGFVQPFVSLVNDLQDFMESIVDGSLISNYVGDFLDSAVASVESISVIRDFRVGLGEWNTNLRGLVRAVKNNQYSRGLKQAAADVDAMLTVRAVGGARGWGVVRCAADATAERRRAPVPPPPPPPTPPFP